MTLPLTRRVQRRRESTRTRTLPLLLTRGRGRASRMDRGHSKGHTDRMREVVMGWVIRRPRKLPTLRGRRSRIGRTPAQPPRRPRSGYTCMQAAHRPRGTASRTADPTRRPARKLRGRNVAAYRARAAGHEECTCTRTRLAGVREALIVRQHLMILERLADAVQTETLRRRRLVEHGPMKRTTLMLLGGATKGKPPTSAAVAGVRTEVAVGVVFLLVVSARGIAWGRKEDGTGGS